MTATVAAPHGFHDLIMKDTKSHLKSMQVSNPIGFSLRRNSGSTVTVSMNFSNKLNNTSSLCMTEVLCNGLSHQQQSPSSPQQQPQVPPSGHRKLDRSVSEPVERRSSNSSSSGGGNNNNGNLAPQQEQRAGNQGGNSSRYKTELCRPFEENGTCKYGDKCQFAHGGHELRTLARHPKYKTELCRTFHTTGFCPYGPRCHFIHNEEESRKSSTSGSPPPMSSVSTMPTTSSGRPKALSIGCYGNLVDDSPPSLSPTFAGNHSFFGGNEDAFIGNNHHHVNQETYDHVNRVLAGFTSSSTPVTPTANNAFKYNRDFTTAFNNYNNHIYTQQQVLKLVAQRINLNASVNLDDSSDNVFRVPSPPAPIVCPAGMEAPPSSPDSSSSSSMSSSSDEDSLSPAGSPTCMSPLDVSKNLRLPIFSQLSISDD